MPGRVKREAGRNFRKRRGPATVLGEPLLEMPLSVKSDGKAKRGDEP
ncbi:hypothetical protein CHY_0395 [Carboxydothermus hydrogenoformans Z-2901]|uniref:Uncharacterized protein n=1 Tax=Carboxydothermus hydrogenoformans (strain ATCC BAA-161 / DSM 6008 / Z-2901) TaxID=246194 RepID=Q3AF28_CARHZ|nr:hypothetical protein CHY_0395 [Carboxydothermus hydrogenoformans Z-2901]